MRSSLNEIKDIDQFLSNKMSEQETIEFKKLMLEKPLLSLNLRLQKRIYKLLEYYHRKSLKKEIEEVHQNIFKDSQKEGFKIAVNQIFK